MTQCYSGPAGVTLTPDEILIVWSHLTRIENEENAEIRRRCRDYLDNAPNWHEQSRKRALALEGHP